VRGRKPKPTEQKKLEGNPGKRALNTREPKPDASIPPCPPHLKGVARTEWTRITKELMKLKMISNLDRASLVAYCTAWEDYVQACNKLATEGAVIFSESGVPYQNPRVGIKNKAMEKIVKISAEFGMTPSSRARLKVETPSEEDEMAGFLFGQNVKVVKK
jgi:P27 family predicted phage terminase small subunit